MCAESGSTCQAEIGGMRTTCFCFNRQWRCPGVDPTPTPRPDGGTQPRPVCGPEVMDEGACTSTATPFCIAQPDGGRAQVCICERDMWNCRRL
jgi:hypothetical protein